MDVNHDEMAQLLTQELVRARHLQTTHISLCVPTAKINVESRPALDVAPNLYISVAVVEKSAKTQF